MGWGFLPLFLRVSRQIYWIKEEETQNTCFKTKTYELEYWLLILNYQFCPPNIFYVDHFGWPIKSYNKGGIIIICLQSLTKFFCKHSSHSDNKLWKNIAKQFSTTKNTSSPFKLSAWKRIRVLPSRIPLWRGIS